MNELLQLTPVYRDLMNNRERTRLHVTLNSNKIWKHAFFGPESLDYSKIQSEFPISAVFKFPDRYFKSRNAYSELMLDPDFYRTFIDYDSILITQLDSIVVNEISKNLIKSFDYVGAPWEKPFWIFSIGRRLVLVSSRLIRPICKQVWVGNGGLSVRNVKTAIDVLTRFQPKRGTPVFLKLNRDLNEDVIISFLMHKYGKRIPSLSEASALFMESGAQYLSEMKEVIGFHALEIYNPNLEEEIINSHDLKYYK
jgi:hypothetical protein